MLPPDLPRATCKTAAAIVVIALAGLALLGAGGAAALAPNVERVSVSSTGAQADSDSSAPSISADGRYVAFESYASNLVAGDNNGLKDVFVRDRQTGTVERVSVSGDGAESNGYGFFAPSISGDGRYVAFDSNASNLVPGDTNDATDVFVHDRQTGATERVSVATSGAQADLYRGSFDASISADGRYVAFSSAASNLVAGDSNDEDDVFVHDRVLGITERVSVSSAGAQGVPSGVGSAAPSISADGRYVAFRSGAPNLVAGDTNGQIDVFVRDRQSAITERVSVSNTGAQANGFGFDPSISADGRYVAFGSDASNLVVGDTNGASDVFVRDRVAGTTERVSDPGGTGEGTYSVAPSISADGRHVAFGSPTQTATTAPDVFVRDRATGALESMSAGGSAASDGASFFASISADGRFVAFSSSRSTLVEGDTNGAFDVFVRERLTATTDAAYARTVLADRPVGYWRFGERGSTVMRDASPNSNDGTYLAGVTLGILGALVGDPDTAASVRGVDGLMRVPDAASLDVGDSFTLEGWIRRTSSAPTTMFYKGPGGPHLVVQDSEVWLNKAGVAAIARSKRGVPVDGAYHHVVATKDGSRVKMYVDGRQGTVKMSKAQVVENTTARLQLGPAARTRADFDEFAIYDRALRPREVFEHYSRGRGS